jgi:hypothetical protein
MYTPAGRTVYQLSTLLFLVIGAGELGQYFQGSQNSGSTARPVQVAMRNVEYHYTADTSVRIRFLHGELYPTKPPQIVVFDDKESFYLVMADAEIAMSCDDLANILNQHVFTASDAPIKNLSVQSQGNTLIIRGKLHNQGGIPFQTTGMLSPTSDGRIRLHAVKVTAAHLPVKGLMDLLGIGIADLINTNKVQGVAAEKDDLLLDPQQILPLPRIQGKVTAVRIEGSKIVESFGSKQESQFDPKISGNYMAYRGNELRFGKLTMHDTDMVLLDMDPQDPFDFFLDHYVDQLVAGYSKTTPTFGLRVYMRDYNKLKPAVPR